MQVAGLILGVIGTGVQAIGAMKQAKAAKRAEELKKKQLQLQAMRQRREQARQAVIARSQALAAGVMGGAEFGSGVAGGMGSVSSQAAGNVASINQDQVVGEKISAQNMKYIQGGAMSSFGGALVNVSGSLGQLGEYMAGKMGQPSY